LRRKLAVVIVCLSMAILAISCAESGTYSKYVKLGQYKGLPITKVSTDVTDDEVDKYIKSILSANGNAKTQLVTDRAVKLEDTVDVDYVGLLDDVAFEGGTGNAPDLVIGSRSFIDGFEAGLIGVNIGEEVSLPLTFPEGYQNSELAGKEVIFNVKVNSIMETVYPELTDELVQSFTDDYTTAEEYVADVRESLETQAAQEAKNSERSEIINQVIANAKISGYPEEELQENMDGFIANYTSYASYYGMDLATFLMQMGTTEEEFNAYAQEYAQNYLNQIMVLTQISEKEKITIPDEDYERIAQANYNMDKAEFVEAFGEEAATRAILFEVTLEFLYENADLQ